MPRTSSATPSVWRRSGPQGAETLYRERFTSNIDVKRAEFGGGWGMGEFGGGSSEGEGGGGGQSKIWVYSTGGG